MSVDVAVSVDKAQHFVRMRGSRRYPYVFQSQVAKGRRDAVANHEPGDDVPDRVHGRAAHSIGPARGAVIRKYRIRVSRGRSLNGRRVGQKSRLSGFPEDMNVMEAQ